MCQESHYVGALENPNENGRLISVFISSKTCILRKTRLVFLNIQLSDLVRVFSVKKPLPCLRATSREVLWLNIAMTPVLKSSLPVCISHYRLGLLGSMPPLC